MQPARNSDSDCGRRAPLRRHLNDCYRPAKIWREWLHTRAWLLHVRTVNPTVSIHFPSPHAAISWIFGKYRYSSIYESTQVCWSETMSSGKWQFSARSVLRNTKASRSIWMPGYQIMPQRWEMTDLQYVTYQGTEQLLRLLKFHFHKPICPSWGCSAMDAN